LWAGRGEDGTERRVGDRIVMTQFAVLAAAPTALPATGEGDPAPGFPAALALGLAAVALGLTLRQRAARQS
jgi:hypothetical protein